MPTNSLKANKYHIVKVLFRLKVESRSYRDNYRKRMRISNRGAEQLIESGIDMGKLLAVASKALEKRTIKRQSLSETKAAFNISESATLKKTLTSELEGFALSMCAFDAHQEKALTLWGKSFEWYFPHDWLMFAVTHWPFKEMPEVTSNTNPIVP